jgi:FG-GAP-like repeat/ASPIC and UnbV/PPIC-type PPIASE domain
LKVWLALGGLLLSLNSIAGQESPAGAVGLRMIVVDSADDAQRILDALKGGADFAAIAIDRSIDPTAPDGGYLGKMDPATLRPELRDALKSVAVGQLTGVVRIPTGYAILEVLADSQAIQADDTSAARILSATAMGAVRDSLNVGGLAEADAVFVGFPKSAGWNQDLREMCRVRTQSIPAILKRLDENPTPVGAADSPGERLDVMQGQYAWAQIHAYTGNMDKAIERWEVAKQIAEGGIPGALASMEETLGLAFLHKSEMDNGAYRTPGDLCLFPRIGAPYPDPAGSEKAVQHFLAYLEQKPDDLEVRWLLNLAYMTLGRYPGGVPQKYLISPSAFESKENIGRFVDVAADAGLNVFSMAGGVIVDRFENDDLLDVVTSSMDVCEPLHYFRNNADGTFSERTAQAGLADQLGGLNLIQADYNNDGCMDILVLRGGWEFPMRKSLLRNNCNGTFTDVTRESGLGKTVSRTQTAVWADVDNDGNLDLFVGNETGPSQLFRNKGDGTFEDISRTAGVDRTGFIKAVVAADYDNDGYVDFYLSDYNGNNLLYHNNHDRTFTDVARQAGVQAPWRSFAAWFFDYDNDGWPDLFVTSYYLSIEEVARSYLGLTPNAETLKLYRNLGNGTFRDVTAEAGLDKVFMPMGANFGDVNNDGYLDMYLGMGSPTFASVAPHELLLNKNGKSFVSITASSGTGELHKGHGIAFADLDRDGDEDIVAEVGGAVPADRHALRLFENPGNGNDWIAMRLVGVRSNRAAIGARIKVTVETTGDGNTLVTRSIYRTVGSGGSFGANPLEQHIGLGFSARIQNVEIWWPASNTRQSFSTIAPNQFIEIKELGTGFTKLDRKPYRLGGVNRGNR